MILALSRAFCISKSSEFLHDKHAFFFSNTSTVHNLIKKKLYCPKKWLVMGYFIIKKKEKQKSSNFGWLYFLMQTFSYSPLSMYNSKTQFSFWFCLVDKDERTIRQCATTLNNVVGCFKRTGTYKIKMEYCECDADGCNSAPRISLSIATAFSLMMGVLLCYFV